MSTSLALVFTLVMAAVFGPFGLQAVPVAAYAIAAVWVLWLLSRPQRGERHLEQVQAAKVERIASTSGSGEDAPATGGRPQAPTRRLVFDPTAAKQYLDEKAQRSALTMGCGARTRDAHFTRHAHTPGWLYVASQDFRPADFFKVGYTTQTPAQRVNGLNEQSKGVSAAVGRFRLVHSRRVARSQAAEARVFELLAAYRVSAHREFFQAPLSVIVHAIEDVAAGFDGGGLAPTYPARTLWTACPDCGRAVSVGLAPHVTEADLFCGPCGTTWTDQLRDDPAAREPGVRQ